MGVNFDVLCIGNAIVDIIMQVDDKFIEFHEMHKGAMQLIDEAKAHKLFQLAGEKTLIAGGSAANTAVGIGSFGGKPSYIGKVKNDSTGSFFLKEMAAHGVSCLTQSATVGPATALSFIFVTPDGQRTMNTFLGACQNLCTRDICQRDVEQAGLIYLEGYLWDPPAAKEAFIKAADIAHKNQNRVALTLSDSFCVERYRGEFLDMIRKRVIDIVFANKSEILALYQTDNLETALQELQSENCLAIVTYGEQGCFIVDKTSIDTAPAYPIKQLVDTTGAGDLFASGFLFGLSQGKSHRECAHLAALAASEIIQHIGARPKVNLREIC